MRTLVFAVVAAAPMLATLPQAAQADPFARGPYVEHRGHFADHHRHGGWEHRRHSGWHRMPGWFKRHHFEHDYGWHRGPRHWQR